MKVIKVLKNILSQLHTFILWAMLCALLWSWIYTFVGDTSRNKKVVIFIDAPAIETQKLDLRLEEHLPDGIKMIRVHDFSYDMFGTATPGDIYIVRESQLSQKLTEQPEALQSFEPPEGVAGMDGVTALVRFLDYSRGSGEVCTAVTDVRAGYLLQSTASAAQRLIPAWCVSTDVNRYYVNMTSGEVTREG